MAFVALKNFSGSFPQICATILRFSSLAAFFPNRLPKDGGLLLAFPLHGKTHPLT
jgi:hypothetical protein